MAFTESAVALGLTISEITSGNRFTVYSGHGVHVEGYKGVLYFDDVCVILRRRGGTVRFDGKNLRIKELSQSDVFITGEIVGVIIKDKAVKNND